MLEKVTMGHIGIYVTEHCLLRCKDCNAGIPYLKNLRHYSVEELSVWIERIFKIIDWTEHVDLIGGEPLTHPQINQICKELYKYKGRFPEMRILTSSTIVPSDELLENICEIIAGGCDFLFYLDNYGECLSKEFNKIKKKLNRYNIKYRVTDYSGENPAYGGWVDYRIYNPPENKGYDERRLKEVFNQCFYYKSGGSFVLRNGYVYPCVFPMTHEFLGQRNTLSDERIDLTDEAISLDEKRKLARYFKERMIPYDACRYCPGLWEGAPRVSPAIQIKVDYDHI
jgi:MoaA/NifB/PqqE/SkfB family radical SAM enzyme